jgi:hypothetical protein
MAVSATLTGNIVLSSGIAGDVALSKLLSLAAISGTVLEGPNALSLSSGANAITLPIATVQFVFLTNTHATQTIAVTWTPTGGASAAINTLGPGDFIVLGTTARSGSGITALSLNASGAATTCTLAMLG